MSNINMAKKQIIGRQKIEIEMKKIEKKHSLKSCYRSLTWKVLRRIDLGVSASYRSILKLKEIKS